MALIAAGIDKAIEQQLSIRDAMVVEAAHRAEAQTLYSEDFGHGQRFGALAVVDPFLG